MSGDIGEIYIVEYHIKGSWNTPSPRFTTFISFNDAIQFCDDLVIKGNKLAKEIHCKLATKIKSEFNIPSYYDVIKRLWSIDYTNYIGGFL